MRGSEERVSAPSMSFTSRLRSWKPVMSSCSELPCPDAYEFWADLETLSPRLDARAESREENEGVERAQREFLRITEVTERISERRICFEETEKTAVGGVSPCSSMLVDHEHPNTGGERGISTSQDGRVRDVSLGARCGHGACLPETGRRHRSSSLQTRSLVYARCLMHLW